MSVKITELAKRIRDLRDYYFSKDGGHEYATLGEAANALETLSAHTAEKGEAEPVGYTGQYTLDELARGAPGNIYPNDVEGYVALYAHPPAPRDDLVAGRLREAIIELARAGSHLREFVRYHPEESTCDIEASLYMVGRIVGQYTNDHPEVLDACRTALERRTDA